MSEPLSFKPKSIFEDLGKLVDSSNRTDTKATTSSGVDSSSIQKEEQSNSDSNQQASPSNQIPKYAGDIDSDTDKLRSDGFQKLDFPNPAVLYAFYNKAVADGRVTLHGWQVEHQEELVAGKGSALHPFKSVLITCNGSGKDAIIITGFCIWFTLCKIRSRVILTSASGVQLSSQTESYIRSFAESVNAFHGEEIFRVRQRYIYCRLTGSEIRFFATDEAGKAEGYHPFEPDTEMAIIVNEAKSVSEEIHGALRRCTGYNYWLEISTPGEPSGFFYRAATSWKHVRKVTTYDCPHLSKDEVEQDKLELGEDSPLFRSKHLALFTSAGGDVLIPEEDVVECYNNPPDFEFPEMETRVGIDLAAGGDEDSITFSKGNKVLKEVYFREADTEIAADRIDHCLKENKISKSCKTIYADDGGVGRSIIDKLVRKGWIHINRIHNQSAAIAKSLYGNRGAENWYRVKRMIEEKVIDITALSEKTRHQIYTRHYKQKAGAKLYLEQKKEAKAEGRPSPDRADSFILSFTGLTVSSFLDGRKPKTKDNRPKVILDTPEDVLEYYENNVTFGKHNKEHYEAQNRIASRNIHGSLKSAIGRSHNYTQRRLKTRYSIPE